MLHWLTHTPVTRPALPKGNFRLNAALAAGNQESAAMKSNTFTPVGVSALGKCQVSGVSRGHMGPRQRHREEENSGRGPGWAVQVFHPKKCGPSWEFSDFLKMLINHSRKKGKTTQGRVCKFPG